jgi:hypothetical protein
LKPQHHGVQYDHLARISINIRHGIDQRRLDLLVPHSQHLLAAGNCKTICPDPSNPKRFDLVKHLLEEIGVQPAVLVVGS